MRRSYLSGFLLVMLIGLLAVPLSQGQSRQPDQKEGLTTEQGVWNVRLSYVREGKTIKQPLDPACIPYGEDTIQFDAEYQSAVVPDPSNPSNLVADYRNGTVRYSARGNYHTEGMNVAGVELCKESSVEWSVANTVPFKSMKDLAAGIKLSDGGRAWFGGPHISVLNQGNRSFVTAGPRSIWAEFMAYYDRGKIVRSRDGTKKGELSVEVKPSAVEESETSTQPEEAGQKPEVTEEEAKAKELAEKLQKEIEEKLGKELEALPERELTPEEAMALAMKLGQKLQDEKYNKTMEKYNEMIKELNVKGTESLIKNMLDSGDWQEYHGEKVIAGSRRWKDYKGGPTHTFTWSFTREPSAEEARVTLDGCTDLTVGKTSEVTASAEPGGGTFRFWAEPAGPLSISASGPTVKLPEAWRRERWAVLLGEVEIIK